MFIKGWYGPGKYMAGDKTEIRGLDLQAGNNYTAHQVQLLHTKKHAHNDEIKQIDFVHTNEILELAV